MTIPPARPPAPPPAPSAESSESAQDCVPLLPERCATPSLSASSGPHLVTLRQSIHILAKTRDDPLITGIRRQRHLARILGSLGGWVGIGGVVVCLLPNAPDSAGLVAILVGLGATGGGAWQTADATLTLRRRDTPWRQSQRAEHLMGLRRLGDALPQDHLAPLGKQRVFVAMADVIEEMVEMVSMRPQALALDVATEAVRGCVWSVMAGLAGALVVPWALWWGRVLHDHVPARQTNVTLSVVATLVAAALPLVVAVAQRSQRTHGAWDLLRRLAARAERHPDRPVWGVDPEMMLPVGWADLERGPDVCSGSSALRSPVSQPEPGAAAPQDAPAPHPDVAAPGWPGRWGL